MRDLCRAANYIDRFVFEQFVTEPLCHTADYADYQVRFVFFNVFEVSEMRKDPLLGVFSNRAGIYQDNISFFNACGQTESSLFKRRTYQRRIQLVHLAPKTFDMYNFAVHIKK